ncbi:MAG TPA: XdhC family protein [Gammaproteobacteria bacterium]|nr:XdhC family protein [Gammaproteobacteria bacterium]
MNAIDYEDIEIIKQSLDYLKNDRFITFCTVARTWGSSPRPPGSLLVISQQGAHFGSVSGGCIEDDLLLKYNAGTFNHAKTTTLTYDTNNPDTAHIKIPCGSILEIVIERISDSHQLKTIYGHLCDGQTINRLTKISESTSSIETTDTTESVFFYDGQFLKRSFGPSWRIIITGANDVSAYVARLGKMLGYSIIICEPRKNYLSSWTLQACEITSLMPDDAVSQYAINFSTIVLSLSHDLKLDDMALLRALELDLFYVGAIGSKKSQHTRLQRLAELGLSQASLEKLHAPVGLNINSKVPAEIAISIFAEITLLRNTR